MAWISVHEDVFGQKLRRLAKDIGCSQAEALGILNALWLWGLKNAEKSGEIKDADVHDVAGAIPVGILSKGLDTLKIVKAMVSTGWIDDIGGVLFLHDWEDWQEQWYKFLDRKAYDAKRKRDKRRQEREAEESPAEEPEGEDAGDQPEGDTPRGGGHKKEKKDEEPKKKYAEFVHMTEAEYDRLVKRFGRLAAEKAVEILDNYKGSKGKRYASDYRAILNWVMDRVREKHPGLIKRQQEDPNGNPYGDWGDDDG